MNATIAVLLATSVGLCAQNLVISEFMASNQNSITDEDGDNEDWIEIYNKSASAVNLEGWFLTDDAGELSKWAFPSVILDSGSQIVVFASKKDRTDPASELHTNFKLASGGEYLAIVQPGGTIVEQHYSPGYPPQVQDVSYGLQQEVSIINLISTGADVTFTVPVNGDHDVDEGNNPDPWIGTDFDDDLWTGGITGTGYAVAEDDHYDPLIGTDVQSLMYNSNETIYIRIPFNLVDPSGVSSLTLKMKYDDGFVAYLNGNPESVAEDNAEMPDLLDYQAGAILNRSDSEALDYVSFPISDPSLQVGTNVLCIHGLNNGTGSSDGLWLPELEATTISGTGLPSYFAMPTPNGANTGGISNPGPVIRSVTDGLAPLDPTAGPVRIEAEVLPTFEPIDSVVLKWRIMYGSESSLPMVDDGTGDDVAAGDGVFTATIPTGRLSAGEMLRWRVIATDTTSGSSKQPQFADPVDSPEYFGTIAADSSVTSSKLPVFHWFTSDPQGATDPSGARGSVYFLGQFYDNIQADRHGQSTGSFPKKSYDFDFNKGDRFLYKSGERRVKDINMLTNWADKSKVRNTLSYEIMNNAGHPGHFAFPVRIQQNALFFSVADMVEDGDDRYLERVGLDGEGALYKMYNLLDSSTTGVNKKTRKEEANGDLQELVEGLSPSSNPTADAKLRYAYDNVNIPGTINYLAALDMADNSDQGHKNYYLYRDTNGTGEWRPLVWDIDLCLGRNWDQDFKYFDDTLTSGGVRLGPWNRLKTLIYHDPTLNEMYLRRMRTIIDKQIGSPGSAVTSLEARIDELVAQIDPNDDDPLSGDDDADLDFQKWGSWGNENAMRSAADRIKLDYIPSRRLKLSGLGILPSSQPVAPSINIGAIRYNPTTTGASPDQSGEYFLLQNPNDFAVDISDWRISGGISMRIPPGTVIPADGTLHVARDAVGFRTRSLRPTAGEKRYMVSGYEGQLSARGETVTLTDDSENLIATTSYAGSPTSGQSFLRVTEILYHPADPTSEELAIIPTLSASDFEFVELTNTGPGPLDIGGTRFVEGIAFTFPDPTVLNSGQHIIVVANQVAFALRNDPGLNIAGEYTGKLSNDGEQLQVLDGVGENVLEFAYNDVWYAPTDGPGHSLVLLDPAGTPVTDFDLPANWGISLDVGGDPAMASAGVAMTFSFWKNQKFTPAEAADAGVTGPMVDLDFDALGTALEYGFGREPRIFDSAGSYVPEIVNDDGIDYYGISFRRQKHAIDLDYSVEMSSDLEVWTSATTMVGTPVDNGDGTETVTIRDTTAASNHSCRFSRVKFTFGS